MRHAILSLLAVGACTEAAAPPTVCGDPVYYRVDSVELPERAADVVPLSLDLDGDGSGDNELGSVLEGIHGEDASAHFAAPASARLAGDVSWYVAVRACDDGARRVEIGDSGGGDAAPVTVLVDPAGTFAPVAWVRVGDLHERLTVTDDRADGVIGFTVPVPGAAHALAAPYAAYLSAELAAGTSDFAAQFDLDHDGVITADEVVASDLGKTFLAPDLPGGRYSVGLGVHATRVELP